MLNHPTIDRLTRMRLPTMANEFRRQLEGPQCSPLSFEERLGMLVDSEWAARQSNRLQRLLKVSGLRLPEACLEDLDYSPERKLERSQVARLANAVWISEAKNLVVTGATGCGKTYLVCAFGNLACRNGFKVRYYRVTRLLTDLQIGRGDGTYNRILRDLKKVDLLILDDWGLSMLDPLASRDLLEIIEDRYKCRSTLIAAQLPVSKWHALFEDSTVADAILDRLLHNAIRFELSGGTRRITSADRDGGDARMT